MIKSIRHKFSIILIILLAGISSSCNKWLEIQPQDGLIRQEYWQTKEQLEAAVIGCYASLLGGSPNPLANTLFMWGELRADMVESAVAGGADEEVLLSGLRGDQYNMMRSDISATNSITNWAPLYQTINYCNTVIKFGPDVLASDNTLTESQLNGYIAEARALRGLMYFYLLRTFGEVPLKLEPTYTDKEVVQMAKNSQQEVYNQIISDLTFATQYASPVYPSLAEEKGRITRYGAYTILADAYLWMEDYQKAIDACNKVIEANRFQLFPVGTLQEEWRTSVFGDGNSVESIFELQFDNQKNSPLWTLVSRDVKAADWIVNGELFGVNVLDPTNRDIRGNGTSILESTGLIFKYATSGLTTALTSHWFVYRYSDVLLMKAEALTWVDPGNVTNSNAAIAIVKDIRARRNALPVVGSQTIEDPDPALPEKVSEYILAERAREFAFEGKRWFDVLRNAKRNNYANEKLLLDMVSASAPPEKQQTVINKYKDHRSHYLPINAYELQTNKALKQNSFYQ